MSARQIEKQTDDKLMNDNELTGNIALIAKTTGFQRAVGYAELYGGVTIYLKSWREEWNQDMRDMVDYFGETDAKAIFIALGYGHLSISSCKNIIAMRRDKKIVAARNAGMPVKDVAKMFNLHERMIRRITRKARG